MSPSTCSNCGATITGRGKSDRCLACWRAEHMRTLHQLRAPALVERPQNLRRLQSRIRSLERKVQKLEEMGSEQ